MPKQNGNAILKVNMLTAYNVKSTNLNQFFDKLVVSAGNNTTVLYFTCIKLQVHILQPMMRFVMISLLQIKHYSIK